ncbi:MAG: anti-sigma factor [Actinobacteria bacterium]|nr:anti-sigma factor [Actinomycetota bacterium]MBW3648377.1 anti-sigma factor [Actinomycetota bacterium]
MIEDSEHRRLRELLGSYALSALPPDVAPALVAHLDGCATCRAELAEIAPLADDLRGVDPDRLSDLATPPAGLGVQIRTAVAEERSLVDARAARLARRTARAGQRRAFLAVAGGVVVLAAGIGLGAAVNRDPRPVLPVALPSSSPSATVPIESLTLEGTSPSSPQVQTAGLIPHTWGVEVRMVGTGFAAGETFRAAFRSRDGRLLPAGEFLGTGEKTLTCNMQAALLRPDTVNFVIMDASGAPVLTTDLPAAA